MISLSELLIAALDASREPNDESGPWSLNVYALRLIHCYARLIIRDTYIA